MVTNYTCRSYCENLRPCIEEKFETFGGNEGEYSEDFKCPYNYFLNGAQLRSEAPQGTADDSARMC